MNRRWARMRNVKRSKLWIVCVLCVFTLLTSICLPILAEELPPDGFDSWEDYYNYLIYGNTTTEIEVPAFKDMPVAAENDNLRMLFHEEGLDVYVLNKKTGDCWSSAIHKDYMDISKVSAEDGSALLEMVIVSADGTIMTYVLTDKNSSDFNVASSMDEDGVNMTVSLSAHAISLDVELVLTADGLEATIPFDSLKEEGEARLLSVHLMPSFGATKIGEDGYVLYPDGSGALAYIKDYAPPAPESYTWPLYGLDTPDFYAYDSQKDQHIENMTLPVFGIKRTTGGMFAAVTAGDGNAVMHMSVSECYRIWFQFEYRMYTTAEFNYTGSSFGGGSISQLLPGCIEGDRSVKYFLLEGDKNTYSDMASVYRKYLEAQGLLTRLEQQENIPLSLEFFMAATKAGILGDSLQVMTTYEQVEAIVKELSAAGIDGIDTNLVGWAAGGYERMPTAVKYENALGGKQAYNSLHETIQSLDATLNLSTGLLIGDKSKASFNTKQDVLRNLLGKPFTDREQNRFFLNVASTFERDVQGVLSIDAEKRTLCLTDVGKLLLPNLVEGDPVSRTEAMKAYQAVLAELSKNGKVSVSGGNYYVLPYVDRLYDIPDTDSGYYQTDEAVPFYQLVTHGYVEYSSTAGNLSENLAIQKLRWLESGSLPHFVITQESSALLKGTGYNELYNSQYTLWKDRMIDVYKEFNEKLGDVWYQNMVEHKRLAEDLVCVTYENGTKIYINYAETAQTVDNITVPSMDYLVLGGK